MDPFPMYLFFNKMILSIMCLQKKSIPIYDRVPYSNNTTTGEAYGTKVKLLNNVDVKWSLLFIN